jgi:hypothetical protein
VQQRHLGVGAHRRLGKLSGGQRTVVRGDPDLAGRA